MGRRRHRKNNGILDVLLMLPWWIVLILGIAFWLWIEFIVVPDFASSTHLKGLGNALDDSDLLIALFFIIAAFFSWLANDSSKL